MYIMTTMRSGSLLYIFLILGIELSAQWAGTYEGSLNGDIITMKLSQQGDRVTGVMKDSYQTYDIVAIIAGDRLAGDAKEVSLGVTLTLLAERQDHRLSCKLIMDVLGLTQEQAFEVYKKDAVTATASIRVTANIPFPSAATFPSALAGAWTKSETYNSGYGSDFMGANFSQSLSFNPDGTLSEGGNSASISGANYSGRSSDLGGGLIEGMGWYAVGDQLYLMIYDSGRWQQALLGKWYAEDGKLLITATSGEKLLLSR